jgi:hypothetical protein
MSHGLGANLMKIRGLLLVFCGVTLGALPAFAPTTTHLTVQNQSQSTPNITVFQKPPELVTQPKAAPKPAKATTKPVKNP